MFRILRSGVHDITIPLAPPVEKLRESAEVAGLSPEKILIIDDEEISRYLVRQALGAGGFVLLEAAEGSEGLERAHREKPDAIFLDLRMPGMSGVEVLSRLKADPQTRNIPVIIITSKSLPESERAMLEMNSVAILSKEIFASGRAGEGLRIALKSAGVALVSSSGIDSTKSGSARQ
ncbi:MAG: response regulator [Acidobacteria bacterium]|nr:response regulator [Acidobacteriota bacterium]